MKSEVACFLLSVILCGVAFAADPAYECPRRVASGDNNFVSVSTRQILMEAYRELGCETEFPIVPLRRGITGFNKGTVDGEVLRATKVEGLYKVPFVRSEKPLFSLINSLWAHPDDARRSVRPIGYIHGILWQEDFMVGKSGEKFHSEDKLYEAYNKGVLAGLLSSDFTINNMLKQDALSPPPYRLVTVQETLIYHYLHQDYSDFMQVLEVHLDTAKPFSDLD